MRRTWPAVLACSLALLLAMGFLFFTVAGPVYLSDWCQRAAAQLGPKWGERLYGLALQADPGDDESRLALAELYCGQQKTAQAETLLQKGIRGGRAGAAVYLRLAALYTGAGRIPEACALLEQAEGAYLTRKLRQSRPEAPALPGETILQEEETLALPPSENALWYALDGGAWEVYRQPLALSAGAHTLSLAAVSPEGIPSEVRQLRCTVERPQAAGWTSRLFRCPYCDRYFSVVRP